MEVSLGYTFDEDGLVKLQKDLNHLLTNLNDQNIKSLRTEYCDISSKGGETVINGALLEMYEYDAGTSKASTTLRLRAGYNKLTSNFEFSLWNTVSTNPTISLNSIGEAVFSGSVNTSNSLYIGNNIFLGQTGSTVNKGLYFNSSTPSIYEEEHTTNLKTALYASVDSTYYGYEGITLSINSTNHLDLVAMNNLSIGWSGGVVYSSSNYLVNYFPFVTLGKADIYNVSLGVCQQRTTVGYFGRYTSTDFVTNRGNVLNSSPVNYMDLVKLAWNGQGRVFEEFQTTDWTVSAGLTISLSPLKARCMYSNGLTLTNTSTSAGDISISKTYPPFDATLTNGYSDLSSDVGMFYVLFYIYDLNKINTLSTKPFQVELASSSGSGDKLRWLSSNMTENYLTTGWNFKIERLDRDYYYSSTNANMAGIQFARFSFEVKANSTGDIATLQHFGFLRYSTAYSTSFNMMPVYDDRGGGYGTYGVSRYSGWRISRISSTGVYILPAHALKSTYLTQFYPTVYAGYTGYPSKQSWNESFKHKYRIKCKNDAGNMPFVGCEIYGSFLLKGTDWSSNDEFGVYAYNNTFRLYTAHMSTVFASEFNTSILYDNVYDITIWKNDPRIYDDLSGNANVMALIEQVGTTISVTLTQVLEKNIWKYTSWLPTIKVKDQAVGCEIQNIEYGYRR